MRLSEALEHVHNGRLVSRKSKGRDFVLALTLLTQEVVWAINGRLGKDLTVDDTVANDYYLPEYKTVKTVSHESILSGLDIAPSIQSSLFKKVIT